MNMVLPRYQQTFLGAEPAAIGMGRKMQEIIPCFPAARLIWSVRAGKKCEEVVFIARKMTYQVVRIVDKIKSSRQTDSRQSRAVLS